MVVTNHIARKDSGAQERVTNILCQGLKAA